MIWTSVCALIRLTNLQSISPEGIRNCPLNDVDDNQNDDDDNNHNNKKTTASATTITTLFQCQYEVH